MPHLFRSLSATLLLAGLVAMASACSNPVDDGQTEGNDETNQTNHNDNQNGQSQICEPGQTRCDGPGNVQTCDDDGRQWQTEACTQNEACDPNLGRCSEQICTPGQFDQCTADGDQRYCNASGTEWVEAPCPGEQPCTDGACPDAECQPGVVRCGARDLLETCNDAGAYVPSAYCPFGTECFDGQCEELCEVSSKVSSYIGCEYWSIDLDNYGGALAEPHAIIITNYTDDIAAEIDLFEGYSDRRILNDAFGQPFDFTIPPGEARIFLVSVGYGHSGTRIFQDKAIRVTSSIPVVAHQFNPLNNVDVYSNDGTVLLPTNSVGTEYWGLSWYYRGGSNVQLRGYITLVNSSTSTNNVTVRPSAEVVSGPDIPTIAAGEERTFSLEPGESLNLVTSGTELLDAQSHGCLADPGGTPDSVDPCPDLTGTHIQADHPITVFGGHQCANVVLGVDRCDHIESILMPVDAWGTSYVGSKFEPRATTAEPEPDIWRVIAAEDDTRLQTDPPIDAIHNVRLDAGEWKQFAVTHDFEIAAEKPIMLAQYMTGANWPGIPRVCAEGNDAFNPTGIGDPAMAIAVPVDQFRDSYIVHTPQSYEEDYLNVIVPIGRDVTLNGNTIPASKWQIVGQMNRFEVATIEVDAGFHTLESDVPFGVVGYGYDCHVSYAYPGGLNVESLDD